MLSLPHCSTFCLLCYKTIKPSNATTQPVNKFKFNSFVRTVNRFAKRKGLDYDSNSLTDYCSNKLVECCNKCEQLIETFCEIYNTLNLFELKLDCIYDKLLEKINYGNKVPARWVQMNRFLEEKFSDELEKKEDFLKWIRKFRQNLIKAGNHRKLQALPRVLLKRSTNVSKLINSTNSKPPTGLKKRTLALKFNRRENQNKKCSICGETNFKSLNIHLRTHKDPSSSEWRCPHCPKTFLIKNNLQNHIRVHTGEKFCENGFQLRKDFKEHLILRHGNEKEIENKLKRKCVPKLNILNEVREKLNYNQKPVAHLQFEDDMDNFTDDETAQTEETDNLIESTTFSDHDDEIACDDISMLNDQIDDDHDDAFEEVDASYDNDYNEPIDSSNLVTLDGTANFKDPQIQIKVEHQPILTHGGSGYTSELSIGHIADINNEDDSSNVQFSVSDPDNGQGSEQHRCQNCGKTFKSAYTLQLHSEYHKDPKDWKYKCETCKKRFAAKYNLQSHARIHEEKKEIRPVYSGATFASRLSTKYLKNKYKKKKKTREDAEKKIGDLARSIVKTKSNVVSQNKIKKRYSFREKWATKFSNEIDSGDDYDDEGPKKDNQYSSSDLSSSPSDNEEDPKSHIPRPRSKKSSSSTKLTFECKICPMKFSTLLKKDNHFKQCHDLKQSTDGKMYSCNRNGCSAYFLKKGQVAKHLFVAHGNKNEEKSEEERKPFKCPQCPKRFPIKSAIERHVKYHKDPSEWEWECNQCEKKFAVEYRLNEHLRSHKEKMRYECRFCEKRFSNPYQIGTHISKEHGDEDFNADELANETIIQEGGVVSVSYGGKLNVPKGNGPKQGKPQVRIPQPIVMDCNICKRKFTSFLRREIHFKLNHDFSKLTDKSKVVKCNAIGCTAYFLKKAQLKTHTYMRHSMGELKERKKNFKCEKCEKWFRSRNHLNLHLEYHKDPSEWKFECEFCGRKSVNENKWRSHVRIHTNERPYQCQFCVEKFRSSCTLRKHLMRWHMDKEGGKAEIDGKIKHAKVFLQKQKVVTGGNAIVNENNAEDTTVVDVKKNSSGVKCINNLTKNNILANKGESFGDGTLVKFEDLD